MQAAPHPYRPVVTLRRRMLPLRLLLEPGQRMSDREYFEFCMENPDLRVERTAEGEIVIVPPAGGESDYRGNKLATQLDRWAERDGRGKVFGPTVQFFLPDGSGLSPDAAWVSNDSLNRLSPQQRKEFLRLSPEFVVEVRSPSDRLRRDKAKMEQWIANGVQLAWLIDGDAKTVYVYRPGRPPETLRNLQSLAGEGPVRGFSLKLQPIWKGLK
jgi:Uma2 family endonuclease